MLDRKINRVQNYILPSPIGGLNQRDSFDVMAQDDAIVMDNYYPSDTTVCLRSGYKAYALENENLAVETLINFCSPGNNRLFAAADGKINDVTAGGNTVVVENLHSNVWSYIQFRNRLLLVNGVDNPLSYYQNNLGEWVWQETSLNGDDLSVNTLCKVAVSKQRVFYVEKNSLCYWYSDGVGEVQGDLNKVDLSFFATRGGYLKAIASWTLDGGQGLDDLTVFITSEGEVFVYAGNSPDDADDWKLKGRYFISKPVGEDCVLQYQGDIVLICEEGYLPLSSVLKLADSGASSIAYSDKIRGLVLSRINT